jgi:TonB family protein
MVTRSTRCSALLLVVGFAAGQAVASEDFQSPTSPEAAATVQEDSTIRRAEPIFKVMRGYEQYGAAGPYFPERASRMGIQGGAALECVLIASGALTKCRVLVEKPYGAGFADASLKMAEKRWMTAAPTIVDGHALPEETVDVLVPFTPRKH